MANVDPSLSCPHLYHIMSQSPPRFGLSMVELFWHLGSISAGFVPHCVVLCGCAYQGTGVYAGEATVAPA